MIYYTLKSEKGSYLGKNVSKVNFEVREIDKLDSNMLSEAIFLLIFLMVVLDKLANPYKNTAEVIISQIGL